MHERSRLTPGPFVHPGGLRGFAAGCKLGIVRVAQAHYSPLAMTKHDRKDALGFGGLSRIARKTRRTLAHVSRVNSEERRDDIIERAIAKDIGKPIEEVFPSYYAAPVAVSAVA